MRIKALIDRIVMLAIFTATISLTSAPLRAQTETLLHAFQTTSGGHTPCGALTFDNAGNLYGTTNFGGPSLNGTVFELSPQTGGGWAAKSLHGFGSGLDGWFPYGNVVLDRAGNLYGTTYGGGTYGGGGVYGRGTVYELSPKAGGGWTETALHSFGNGSDGAYPQDGLILDAAGNLYGTTGTYGPNGGGIVYELSPKAGGGWTYKILHAFGVGKDGSWPNGRLTLDAAGNLYGATYDGGAHQDGMVFELTPAAGHGWSETPVYSFTAGVNDGMWPNGSLALDAAGNLYGVTSKGGAGNVGTVFELSQGAGGEWISTVLHSFGVNSSDGTYPQGDVIFDASGNLYGMTSNGGTNTEGVVYKLSPGTGGTWTETLLQTFDGANGKAESAECGGLILNGSGNLYGTTSGGGPHQEGVVFEITP
jgi:uncharacterized repeat protein (TIGR03803 family)